MNDEQQDARTSYLETIHTLSSLIDSLAGPIKIIENGEPERIQEIAQNDPESIKTVIVMMSKILGKQRDMINDLVESWFKAMDDSDEVSSVLKDIIEKYKE